VNPFFVPVNAAAPSEKIAMQLDHKRPFVSRDLLTRPKISSPEIHTIRRLPKCPYHNCIIYTLEAGLNLLHLQTCPIAFKNQGFASINPAVAI
jgi:hypothetical protein